MQERWAVRAAVVGAGLALLAGCSAGTAPQPAASPSSSTPVATATPTPTSTPVLLSTVTLDPRLPSASPLPAGLLAETDASWLLAFVAPAELGDWTGSVHYLVSPEGDRYELPALGGVSLSQWLPGTPYALGLRDLGAGSLEVQVVDLETARPVGVLDWPALQEALPATTSLTVTLVGDRTTDLLVLMRTDDGGRLLRVAADGTVRASVDADWSNPTPAPGGARSLAVDRAAGQVVEIDPDTLQVIGRPMDEECWPSWVDATRWLARCHDGTQDTWVLVGPGGAGRLPLEGEVSAMLARGDGSVLLTVADWQGPEILGQRVVSAKDGAVEDVETPLAWVAGATGTALIGHPTTPDQADDHGVVDLSAPLVGWRPGDATTTTLVPPGQAGAANVLPVSAVGDSSPGVWLSVRDDGGLQGPLD